MTLQETSNTKKGSHNKTESPVLPQKSHDSPADATRTNQNIHQVLFNPYLLANIMKYVKAKKACLQVNKAWNNIIGQEYYKAQLMRLGAMDTRGILTENILGILEQSLYNEIFESCLAHVLKQEDTVISFRRKSNGGFPVYSIAQFNSALNPQVTHSEIAGASLALAMEATSAADFQYGTLELFEITIDMDAAEEMTSLLIKQLEIILEFLPTVDLLLNIDQCDGISEQLIKLCSNTNISTSIVGSQELDIATSESVEDIRCVLDNVRSTSIGTWTRSGVAPFEAIQPHHVDGTDLTIYISKLDDVALLDAVSDLLNRLGCTKIGSLNLVLHYDRGSLSNWLDIMWRQPLALPTVIGISARRDYRLPNESLPQQLRSQREYQSDVDAFNLRHFDSNNRKYAMRADFKCNPIKLPVL